MTSEHFDIVLLFYNKPKLTMKCIHNLLRITCLNKKNTYGIYLVNNGSNEPVLYEIEKKIKSHEVEGSFDNVSFEILSMYPNRGFASGMNLGLRRHFQGNDAPVLCMSNDVELDPGFFENFSGLYAEKKIEHGILCPHVFYQMDKSKPSYTHGRFVQGSDDELTHEYDGEKKLILFPDYYPAAATVWTKKAYEKTGGFNEKFYCYWEDVELSYRCKELGVSMFSACDLKIFHLGRGTTSGKKSYYAHFLEGRKKFGDISGL